MDIRFTKALVITVGVVGLWGYTAYRLLQNSREPHGQKIFLGDEYRFNPIVKEMVVDSIFNDLQIYQAAGLLDDNISYEEYESTLTAKAQFLTIVQAM